MLKTINNNNANYEEEQIMINTYVNIKLSKYNKTKNGEKRINNKKIKFCEKTICNNKNIIHNQINKTTPVKSILKSKKTQPVLSISSNGDCNDEIYVKETVHKNNINQNLLSTIGPERGKSPVLSYKINSGEIDENINSNTTTELRPSPYSSTNSSLSESVDDINVENGENGNCCSYKKDDIDSFV
jgi:hypothetical protein